MFIQERQHFIILEKNAFQLSAWPAPLIKVKKEEKGFEKHANNPHFKRSVNLTCSTRK